MFRPNLHDKGTDMCVQRVEMKVFYDPDDCAAPVTHVDFKPDRGFRADESGRLLVHDETLRRIWQVRGTGVVTLSMDAAAHTPWDSSAESARIEALVPCVADRSEEITYYFCQPQDWSGYSAVDVWVLADSTPPCAAGGEFSIVLVDNASGDEETWQVEVWAPADLDRDSDVDQEDFGHFQACLSGSGQPPPAGCDDADLDADGDVDQADFSTFSSHLAGADVPPGC